MIHVIATIELHPGKRAEFLDAFHALMPAVHAEDGCLEYGPTVDAVTTIGAQIPHRENTVTIERIRGARLSLADQHRMLFSNTARLLGLN